MKEIKKTITIKASLDVDEIMEAMDKWQNRVCDSFPEICHKNENCDGCPIYEESCAIYDGLSELSIKENDFICVEIIEDKKEGD